MLLLFSIRELSNHLCGKEFFIRFTVCVFRERCASFSFCLKGGIWDLIVLFPLMIAFLDTRKKGLL